MSRPSCKRSWNNYDVYLFDIDGTLLECSDAVHYFAFCHVLELLAGRSLNLDGVVANGNTDIGILRDALQLADIPEKSWRGRVGEARVAMCRYVEEHKKELRISVLPEVVATLDYLRGRGALLGVATGNLEAIGKRKLDRCGLLSYFGFGGYSDECEYRSDVFRGALEQARHAAGPGACVCVVGDTPADVQAAHANNLDVIAVATGVFPVQCLAEENPEWCFGSLAELQATREWSESKR
jgi:phosphoglycolate phosphatase